MCQKLAPKALVELKSNDDPAACPHSANETGFANHMYVKEHPQLINAIHRGTIKYREDTPILPTSSSPALEDCLDLNSPSSRQLSPLFGANAIDSAIDSKLP